MSASLDSETLTLSDRDRDILRVVLSQFADQIDRVSVFGSRALGRAHSASDIDLAIYGGLDDAVIARIWSLLDESSLAVTVDVVRYDGLAGTSLRRHIDQYAKPLFDRADLQAAVATDRDGAAHARGRHGEQERRS